MYELRQINNENIHGVFSDCPVVPFISSLPNPIVSFGSLNVSLAVLIYTLVSPHFFFSFSFFTLTVRSGLIVSSLRLIVSSKNRFFAFTNVANVEKVYRSR